MQRIKKETLTQQVGKGIKAYIDSEQLQPGDKLPSEKELIQRFGVSRTVVREALKSLEMLNIIRMKQGDGIYVAESSMKDITHHISFQWERNPKTMRELLAIRTILETAALEKVILAADVKRWAPMEMWNMHMEDRMNRGLIAAEEDFQFHRALIRATGNDMLFQMSDILYSFFENVQQSQNPDDMILRRRSVEEHKEILHWIRLKHIGKAQESLRRHLAPLERNAELMGLKEDGK